MIASKRKDKVNLLEREFLKYSPKSEAQKLSISRVAKVTLGSSVIRTFKSGTKEHLESALKKIDLDSLKLVKSKEQYDAWHLVQLNAVSKALSKTEGNGVKLGKGIKWGHAAKVLNIFIALLVFYSPVFEGYKNIGIIKNYLHAPFDSKVFKKLKELGVKDVPTSIKSIDLVRYRYLQNVIYSAARNTRVSPFLLDEIAWPE